ncbi:MAG: hypothetical protein K2P95_03440 [Hyphomonadaceae bacterium]|nr:hypothetical protein [Hyphomonadaceae bacterium]
MAIQDWIRLGYIMGALIAIAAAMLERRRKNRRGMLTAVLIALVLLFAGRMYQGGLRAVDYLTSIASTFAGAALLGSVMLRKRRS